MCTNNEIIYNLENNEALDLEKVSNLNENSMLVANPNLFRYWSFIINEHFGLDIYKATRGSDKKAWWYCDKCNEVYDCSISHKIAGRNCPYCSSRRVGRFNNVAHLYPELISQWHPILNGELTPYDVPSKSNKKAWWICSEGHSIQYFIKDKTGGINCSYCYNRKVLVGYNDLWTTHPHIAELLVNPEDGYKYVAGSSTYKLEFKCSCCKVNTANKIIDYVCRKGFICPECSDGVSYPEKVMFNILKEIEVEFDFQKVFKWSNLKRYDFYIPSLNMIIETHGEQHSSEKGFVSVGGKTLAEEKKNDKLKFNNALNNGISHYLVIDCSKSEIGYIKDSILRSGLIEFFDFDKIDWCEIHIKSIKSWVHDAIDLWNKGLSTSQIANKLKLSRSTIASYIKKLIGIGILDGGEFFKKRGSYRKKPYEVVKLTLDGDYICTYQSLKSASEADGISKNGINNNCIGKTESFEGFQWFYKHDYIELKEKNEIKKVKRKIIKASLPVAQIDIKSNKIINVFSNSKVANVHLLGEITNINGEANNLIRACNGITKTHRGYRWIFVTEAYYNSKLKVK